MALQFVRPGNIFTQLNNNGERTVSISYVNDPDAVVIRLAPNGSVVTAPGVFPQAATYENYLLYQSGSVKTFESHSADGSHVLINFADTGIRFAYGPVSTLGGGTYEHGAVVSSTFTSPLGYTITQSFSQGRLVDYRFDSNKVHIIATHDIGNNTYQVSVQNPAHETPLVASGGGNIDPFVRVISNDGSSIISQDGAGLTSGGAINLIYKGTSIISQDGAGLKLGNIASIISDHAAGIISDHAAGIISDHAAGIHTSVRALTSSGRVNTPGSSAIADEAFEFVGSTLALYARGQSHYSGSNTFTSGPADDNTDFRIAIGASRVDKIDFLGDVDLWSITNEAGNAERLLIAGQTYLIDLKGSSSDAGTLMDPFLRVYAADKSTLVAQADDGGAGFNSRLLFTPTTTGFYYIEAGARDDGSSGTYILTVQDPSPVINSNGGGDTAGILIAENTDIVTTVTANDPDSGTTLQYSISGGADAARFGINAGNGILFFLTPPNFELPNDTDHNNSYLVEVQASDGTFFDRQLLTVSVTDVNEGSAAPEIAVWGNHTDITDGDTTPSSADHTAFGTVLVGSVMERSFAVINQGSANLLISKIAMPKGFSIVEPLNGTIAPGGFDFFTVRMDTSKVGAKLGNIVITSNDASERTFDFAINGHVVAAPPPEIEVSGNGIVINDGDMTPTNVDHTDFGTVGIGETVTRTFTVDNNGESALTISKMKLPKGFVLVEGLSATIAPGGSDTFTVRVDTAKVGVKSGSITFTTNDPNESAFDFALKANVIVIPPEIEVRGNGNVIPDNDTSPSVTDGTAFGDVALGSTAIQTFTVNNTGAGVLSISKLKMPKGFVLVEGLSATIAPGQADTFQVRVDTNKIGVKTGILTFTTNDPDETPFNFTLSATVTAAPLTAGVTAQSVPALVDAIQSRESPFGLDLLSDARSPLDDPDHNHAHHIPHNFDLL